MGLKSCSVLIFLLLISMKSWGQYNQLCEGKVNFQQFDCNDKSFCNKKAEESVDEFCARVKERIDVGVNNRKEICSEQFAELQDCSLKLRTQIRGELDNLSGKIVSANELLTFFKSGDSSVLSDKTRQWQNEKGLQSIEATKQELARIVSELIKAKTEFQKTYDEQCKKEKEDIEIACKAYTLPAFNDYTGGGVPPEMIEERATKSNGMTDMGPRDYEVFLRGQVALSEDITQDDPHLIESRRFSNRIDQDNASQVNEGISSAESNKTQVLSIISALDKLDPRTTECGGSGHGPAGSRGCDTDDDDHMGGGGDDNNRTGDDTRIVDNNESPIPDGRGYGGDSGSTDENNSNSPGEGIAGKTNGGNPNFQMPNMPSMSGTGTGNRPGTFSPSSYGNYAGNKNTQGYDYSNLSPGSSFKGFGSNKPSGNVGRRPQGPNNNSGGPGGGAAGGYYGNNSGGQGGGAGTLGDSASGNNNSRKGSSARQKRSGNKQVYSNRKQEGKSGGGFLSKLFGGSKNKQKNDLEGRALSQRQKSKIDPRFDPDRFKPSQKAMQRAMARATGRSLAGMDSSMGPDGKPWPRDIIRLDKVKNSKLPIFHWVNHRSKMRNFKQ